VQHGVPDALSLGFFNYAIRIPFACRDGFTANRREIQRRPIAPAASTGEQSKFAVTDLVPPELQQVGVTIAVNPLGFRHRPLSLALRITPV
jgi:hypothetical protein